MKSITYKATCDTHMLGFYVKYSIPRQGLQGVLQRTLAPWGGEGLPPAAVASQGQARPVTVSSPLVLPFLLELAPSGINDGCPVLG